ncbi:MAG: hypothetical protein ACFB10_17940 [Salibacteraceae bacterium]
MKLEYLPDLTAEGKYKNVEIERLLRLWDFDHQGARWFQQLLQTFIDKSEIITLPIHEQPEIEALNCTLNLVKTEANHGIVKLQNDAFNCEMNYEGYQHMIQLISPFTTKDSEGYQWLDEQTKSSDIYFLFSPGGSW